MPGTLFVVATPIGNLEDITLRALRILRDVAVIAAEDTRRTAHLLARHAITTPTTSLHEHNETAKAAAIVARLRRGDDVALVSDAGTPTVSDPGTVLIRAAREAGVHVEPIPGPSAVLAALAASGFETASFAFLGFPPTKAKDRIRWFERLAAIRGTVVFFEAPHRIIETLADLRRVAGDCEVAVGRELTKAHEEMVIGQIAHVIQSFTSLRGEFTIVARVPEQIEVKMEEIDFVAEFGEMTTKSGLTRRKAIGALARRHGIAPNEVYARLEEAKKSVK
ncbi:MAG TPA: 16S rRNA (cytidine(1402)-2'-O)-methyltransferase [Vicinamibacterales bacterium]|nr:16S rRNA (cytidine(1402)-2'-O)-methyltransferase [Vicinamibacterales bacterium]